MAGVKTITLMAVVAVCLWKHTSRRFHYSNTPSDAVILMNSSDGTVSGAITGEKMRLVSIKFLSRNTAGHLAMMEKQTFSGNTPNVDLMILQRSGPTLAWRSTE